MLTMNKAKRLALDALASSLACPSDLLVVRDDLTQCRRIGWVFFVQPESGTGPVVVTHEGVVHRLRGDRDAGELLHELEQRARALRRAR